MNCKFCGAPLEEGVTLCPACGKDNADEASAAPAVPVPETPEETPPEASAPAQASPEGPALGEDAPEGGTEAPGEETALSEEASEGDVETPSEETALAKESPEGDVETPSEETALSEEITESDVEAPSEEEAPAPKKKKTWVVVTAVAALIALAIGLAAAVFYGVNGGFTPRENNVLYKDSYTVTDEEAVRAADKVVASIGGEKLTNSQLRIYYWTQVYDFLGSDYAAYLVDYTKPLDQQQTGDGSNYQQYFLDVALETWHRFQALALKAQEAGVEMDDALKEDLANFPETAASQAEYYGFESADAMLQSDMGPGVSMDDYLKYIELYYQGYSYFNSRYEEINPTAEEVAAYFEENAETYASQGVTKESGRMVDVRHILIQPEGGTVGEDGSTVYTDEAWTACLEQIQAVYDEWLAGDATEETFAALAAAHSVDSSASSGGLISNIYEGYTVQPFNDWCMDPARAYGDHALVKTEYGYHIIFFVGGQEIWYRYAESDLIGQTANEIVEAAMADYPMEVKYRNIVLADVRLAEES